MTVGCRAFLPLTSDDEKITRSRRLSRNYGSRANTVPTARWFCWRVITPKKRWKRDLQRVIRRKKGMTLAGKTGRCAHCCGA